MAHLPSWDVTAIEIALDLEISDPSRTVFSGPAEPRICLVAALAWTLQIKRIIAAVDRALPARLPPGLRIARSTARRGFSAAPDAISVQPMPMLLRLQQKFVRAIKPGLANSEAAISFGKERHVDEASARFIRDFIPNEALPVFEPSHSGPGFEATDLRGLGITIYRLGDDGAPQSILSHWAYAPDSRGSRHLASGP